MTERLYYTDAYATEFDAEVIRTEPVDGGIAAVLNRTAFYPASGGQPCDTGVLGGAHVTGVVDADDGTVRHIVDGAIAPGIVRGRIDWTRRFDHMQQHTGQHVLSAAFEQVLGARTESFHLGPVSATIDLARDLSPADIKRAEDEANRIVWEDRPVTIRFADAAEAERLPLRKASLREGTLRLVDVEGFDLSACGGTHVARTGAIGVIAIASWERLRGGLRVEFVCGSRALNSYRTLRDAVTASVRLVSVLPQELPAGIERLQADAKNTRSQLKDLHGRLAQFEAAELAGRAETVGSMQVVAAALGEWDQNGLKAIASAIASRPGHVAVLFSTPAPSAVVLARAADVAVDCAAALKALVAKFGGKGGGRPELAQGGGLQGSADELILAARGLWSEQR